MGALVIAGTFTNASLSAFAVAVSSAVLVLVTGRHTPEPTDAVDALTARVRERNRHPIRYAVQHPIDTVRRMLKR